MKLTIISILLIAIISFLACDTKKAQATNDKTTVAIFDMPFVIKMDEITAFENDDLSITFQSIAEDSRCPEETTCVWEGQVIADFLLTTAAINKNIQITRKGKSKEAAIAKFKSYEIMLLEVNPYPKGEEKIKPEDYKLKLVVKRL